jgi:phage terminase large subunit-like protein
VILTVPKDDAYYPTLGPAICDFIESRLVFGPGDLRGQPARLDAEKRALVYRAYEVFPKDHKMAGRRRFKRVAWSLRKGSAKTEFAAWIAACELHPEGPVRTVGWTYDKKAKAWLPVGGPVTDPYIPLVAYTEKQTEELAYGALRMILELAGMGMDGDGTFDIGYERIMRRGGDGVAVPVSNSPDARDGARTTFQHFDETHRFTLPRQLRGYQSMQANIPKRFIADAWSLETTTAYEPGTNSVAEATMDYAKAIAEGKVSDARMFFFHRGAGPEHDISTEAGVRAAILDASGPVSVWSDIESIVEEWRNPTIDRAYFERVWLNRVVQASAQAFDVAQWKLLARPSPVQFGDAIALGFDGSMFHDSTAMVATHIETGYQWVVAVWERHATAKDWKVPAVDVDATVRETFNSYHVVAFYCDPFYWTEWTAKWIGEFGKETVHEWATNRPRPMSTALAGFKDAIAEGTISHSGDVRLTSHIGNARKKSLPQLDDRGQPMWNIQKERGDSPHKIDLAMAAVLSWEARTDAIAQGALMAGRSVYDTRGLASI